MTTPLPLSSHAPGAVQHLLGRLRGSQPGENVPVSQFFGTLHLWMLIDIVVGTVEGDVHRGSWRWEAYPRCHQAMYVLTSFNPVLGW